MHQRSKIERVLNEFASNIPPSKLPADPNVTLTKEMCPTSTEDIHAMSHKPYRRLLGILLHIGITARFDILTAVSCAGKFLGNMLIILD
jgi:hypothetical protein